MSIINLEKTFENNPLVYCNLNNKIIIECVCFTKLFIFDEEYYSYEDYDEDYNEKFGYFICDKVKIIAIYDIYKNIISKHIQTYLFEKQIKIGEILENLKEKHIHFFKTFIGAFITNNKINNKKYTIDYIGNLNYIVYNNIEIILPHFGKIFHIYDNEKKLLYEFIFYNDSYCIYCNDFFITIYNNNIKIIKCNDPFEQIIYCSKEKLKIFKIDVTCKNTKIYKEKRNNNNEIIMSKEYYNKKKKKFISDNNNPPFSKPLRKICIELIDNYKKNINNYFKIMKSLFKKEKEAYNILLLNYNLEMINSK